RAAFTLNVLDRITYHQAITGGNLLCSTLTGYFTSTDPRVLVGEAVLLKHHSITSTIFGPVLLDFGTVGMIIQMFLMGFILETLHILQKYHHGVCTAFYSIILAQSIIWLETGPTDLIVFIFYIISILLIVYNLNIIHKQNN
ncbi:MAG: oligosaccharide repeat unit polymerase, partial [Methanobrevibacter sp.]